MGDSSLESQVELTDFYYWPEEFNTTANTAQLTRR